MLNNQRPLEDSRLIKWGGNEQKSRRSTEAAKVGDCDIGIIIQCPYPFHNQARPSGGMFQIGWELVNRLMCLLW